jgi:hypothetical protein
MSERRADFAGRVPLGAAIRGLLGPRHARRVGHWYRGLFVDLSQVAAALATVIPRNAHVLDIGGGDGEPLNYLLATRHDLRITTLDVRPVVGQWIEERFNAQVTRLPGTSLAEYLAAGGSDPDALLIADVLHHIAESARPAFFQSIRVLLDRVPHLRIVVKDVEPGSWRAALGYLSDRYVTGDRQVSLVSRVTLMQLVQETLGPLRCEHTNLFNADRPNYAIAFFR